MSDFNEEAARQRQARREREEGAARALTEAYGAAWERLQTDLQQLTEQMQADQQAGESISPAWLLYKDRLPALQARAAAEVRNFADAAEVRIREEQAHAVSAAQAHAGELLRRVLGGAEVRALPAESLADLVGQTGAGTPLETLLGELPPAAAQKVRERLLAGVATGQKPEQIAASLRDELGGNLARAQTIARTETQRVYRETLRRTFAAHADRLEGWIWTASLGANSCACCVALHGSRHALTETQNGHPNCRCTMAPWPKDGEPPVGETGEAWLRGQPEPVQAAVLGKAGAEAWRAGEVSLHDFVGTKHSQRWGTTHQARSLNEAREAAARRSAPPGYGPSTPVQIQEEAKRRRVEPEEVARVLEWLNDSAHPDPAGWLVDVSAADVESVAAYLHSQIAGSWLPNPEWGLILKEHPAARAIFLHEGMELDAYAKLGVTDPFSVERPGPIYHQAHAWASWRESEYWEALAKAAGEDIPAAAFLRAHPVRSLNPKEMPQVLQSLNDTWNIAVPEVSAMELEQAQAFYVRYQMTREGMLQWLRKPASGP